MRGLECGATVVPPIHHSVPAIQPPCLLQLAEGRGPGLLVPELLVGFDPLPLLLKALEERFGHLAIFGADGLGGGAVGIKWRPAAFLPAPVKVRVGCAACGDVTR